MAPLDMVNGCVNEVLFQDACVEDDFFTEDMIQDLQSMGILAATELFGGHGALATEVDTSFERDPRVETESEASFGRDPHMETGSETGSETSFERDRPVQTGSEASFGRDPHMETGSETSFERDRPVQTGSEAYFLHDRCVEASFEHDRRVEAAEVEAYLERDRGLDTVTSYTQLVVAAANESSIQDVVYDSTLPRRRIDVPLAYQVSKDSLQFVISKLVLETMNKKALIESEAIIAMNAHRVLSEEVIRCKRGVQSSYLDREQLTSASTTDVMNTVRNLRKCLNDVNIRLESAMSNKIVKEGIRNEKEMIFMCRVNTSYSHNKLSTSLTDRDTNGFHLVMFQNQNVYSHLLASPRAFFKLPKSSLSNVLLKVKLTNKFLIKKIVRAFIVHR
jgi:hypothetical protein